VARFGPFHMSLNGILYITTYSWRSKKSIKGSDPESYSRVASLMQFSALLTPALPRCASQTLLSAGASPMQALATGKASFEIEEVRIILCWQQLII